VAAKFANSHGKKTFADNIINALYAGQGVIISFGKAAGDNDPRAGVLSYTMAYRIPGFPVRNPGYSAGINKVDIGFPAVMDLFESQV
jgi:hypothetical protein